MPLISASLLHQEIAYESRRLGFDLFGVTTPEPPQNYALFEAWLKAGRQAGMAYMASEASRQRRADPSLLLPECQSILIFGIRYTAPGTHRTAGLGNSQISGRTAAYAWGEDYHEVIPEKLEQLAAFIEKQTSRPIRRKIYTDSGPILERELAQRAGLGWIGKNSCLINPKTGSFFLLGEMLVDIYVEADQTFAKDHCGTCRRCLEACPTGCILPNRTIDSAHCISYLTIENKGVIPEGIRPRVENWVFGCDICQQVCPWNQRLLNTSGAAAFHANTDKGPKDLIAEMSLSVDDLNRKMIKSPLQRAKRRGYLRNVATALGNARDLRAVPILSQSLGDSEPLVRLHTAWALGQIGGEDAVKSLENALAAEKDPAVLQEIMAALRSCRVDSQPEI